MRNQGRVERFGETIGSKKETPNRYAVAGFGVLPACRSLQTGQPRDGFLLALAIKNTQGMNARLGRFQTQHGSLPFNSVRFPRDGINDVPITFNDQQFPTLPAENKFRQGIVFVPFSATQAEHGRCGSPDVGQGRDWPAPSASGSPTIQPRFRCNTCPPNGQQLRSGFRAVC